MENINVNQSGGTENSYVYVFKMDLKDDSEPS